MNTQQYLDAAKKKLGIESDYALAAHLGMTRQGVSKLRRGVVVMSNTAAAIVAETLDVDLRKVIADLELERGTNDELWKRIARKVAGVVVPIAAAGAIAAVPAPAEANAAAPQGACVLCKIPRRWFEVLPAALRALIAAIAPWLILPDDELVA